MPNLDFHGRTEPVRLAFQGQNVTQLQLCLNEDPELVNYRRDDNCGTAWLKAMAGGKASTAFLQTLLDYNADTKVSFLGQRNMLHLLANSANEEHLKFVQVIDDEYLPDIHSTTEEGYTPLHAACLQGITPANIGARIKVIDWLLSKGACPNAVDIQGHTPAQLAKLQGLDVIAAHLSNGPVVVDKSKISHMCDFWGRTLLTRVAFNGNLEQADAIYAKHPEQLETKSFALGSTPLIQAFGGGRCPENIIEWLLEKRADIDATSRRGNNILHFAANAASPVHINILQSLKKLPDVNAKNNDGNTPLHAVCMQGGSFATIDNRKLVIDWLLKLGANPFILNNDGLTPGQEAKRQGLDPLHQYIKANDPLLEQINYKLEGIRSKIPGQGWPQDYDNTLTFSRVKSTLKGYAKKQTYQKALSDTQIEKTVLYSKQVGQAIASEREEEIEFRYIKNRGVKA